MLPYYPGIPTITFTTVVPGVNTFWNEILWLTAATVASALIGKAIGKPSKLTSSPSDNHSTKVASPSKRAGDMLFCCAK